MDKTSIIGIVLGVIAISVGMVLKGASLAALVNPAALLIIFVGTAASVCVAFPASTVKNVPVLLKIIFTKEKNSDIKGIIHLFTKWANISRREGILALESQLDDIEDPFLLSGLQLIVDGKSPDFIQDILLEKIDAMEERHQKGIQLFSQAGTYAPTLGVLGAVIGLVAALGNLTDIDALGHAISAAFIATLFGIFSGYVLWHPFSNKLREKSINESQIKRIMIEGLLSIANGESPQVVQEKLSSYVSTKGLAKLNQGDNDEAEE